MPNEINLYETRRMLGILQEIPPVPTFLRNEFFRNTIQSDTDTIDLDIVKKRNRVVPYVRPVQEGVIIERGGFSTNSYKMPYIKVKRASEADKYVNRSPGDTPYTPEGPAARAAREMINDFAELTADLDLEEERQAAEAIFTGKVTIRNEAGTAIQNVDFQLPVTHNEILTGTALWSDPSQKKNEILQFLRTKRRLLIQDGGIPPTDIVLATDVSDVVINKFDPNDETSGLSSVRVDRGQIDIRNLPNGVTYIGYFKELGCDLWSYDGTYVDLDGTVKPYAPAGKIAMLSRNARFDRNYAAIKNFHAGFAAVPRFPLTWIEQDGRARFIQIESAPLYAPHQVDALYVAQVL
jgi:hypothetical protein